VVGVAEDLKGGKVGLGVLLDAVDQEDGHGVVGAGDGDRVAGS